MARRTACWGAALLLALPQFAWALGLGSIELRSSLNQPLDAEIPLTSATDEDLASLRVEVAGLEAFQRQGLERPAFLNSLRFSVAQRPDGTPVLRVTSTQAAREPFLTFLVEARWARGRVLREYTVLLDPPTFTATPGREAPVAAPRTPAVEPDDRTGRVARPAPAPAPRAPAAQLPSPALADDGSYLVQRNDTLSGLAARLRPADDISLNQMMMGLFEANPQAFDGNINRLRAGARLAIPSAESLRRLAPAEASARVAAQNRDWRAAPAAEPAPRLRLVAPGEAEPTRVADAAAAVAAADEARAEAAALRDESVRLRDELAETRRLLELRDTELAELQQQLAEQRSVADAPAVAPAPGLPGDEDRIFVDDATPAVAEPAPAPAPTAEAPRPAPQPAPPPPPGLLEQAMAWLTQPLLWIALGGVALLGALAVFLRRRRQDAVADDPWEAAVAEDLADEQPVSEPSPAISAADRAADGAEARMTATGASGVAAVALATGAQAARSQDEQTDRESAEAGVQAHEVAEGDPLAEADFHMAYGLYDQAADLVQQALTEAPERSDLHLKLVEIYFVWGNQEGFVDAARALKAQVGDGAEWDKTLIMARQICPDESLFAGETASGDLELDFEGGEDTGIYSLDFEVDEAADGGLDRDTSAGLDMQFEDDPEAAEAAAEKAFMLDIGSRTATNIERGLLEDDDAAADSPTIESPELSETAESPAPEAWAGDETVESPRPDSAATVEAPTLEQPRPGDFDARLQGLDAGSTAEIDLDDLGLDLEGLDVELSDEDIEVTGLGEAVIDLGDADQAEQPLVDAEGTDAREALFDIGEPEITGTQAVQTPGKASPEEDEDLLSATGITQVLDERELAASRDEMLLDDNDATRLAPSLPGEDDPTRRRGSLSDDDATRFAGSLSEDDETLLAESLWDDDATRLADTLSDDEGVDRGAATARIDVGDLPEAGARRAPESVDEGADTAFFQAISEEAAGDNTVEQPRPGLLGDEGERFAVDVFGDDASGTAPDVDDFDLEIGEMIEGGGADDPTGEIDPSAEPETLTELGTKLDLARAYIDMGDPEGARSILEEVIEEGDGAHRQEARQLLETLGD